MQSVIIDFGTKQYKFLTIDVEKLSFNWVRKRFFFPVLQLCHSQLNCNAGKVYLNLFAF